MSEKDWQLSEADRDNRLNKKSVKMTMKARAHFRLIEMPCCRQLLCWVNPRLPNYCPECGKFVFASLKTDKAENILESHEDAWISYTGKQGGSREF